MMISGLVFPRASAALGAGWLVGRLLYAVGYTRKDKERGSGRSMGLPYYFCQLGLMGLAAYSGWDMLR